MNGELPDDWTFCAFKGAQHKGYKIVFFEDGEVDSIPSNQFVVGWIDNTIQYFEQNGIEVPEALNIPNQLNYKHFTGRFYKQVRAGELKNNPKKYQWPLFIKPKVIKKFASGVLSKPDSIKVILNDAADDDIAIISEVIPMDSEWRCFVMEGKLVGMQWYAGDFTLFPDVDSINSMIIAYTEAPIAYTLDVAVVQETSNGIIMDETTLLVECNDAWSICNYGLVPEIYIEMLEKRWEQIFKKYPHVKLSIKETIDNNYYDTLFSMQRMLKRYEDKLTENPDSVYYSGLIENTKEAIEQFKKTKEI